MNIIELIKTDKKLNELYFIIARSHFLENEKKGILNIKTKENYYECLKKGELPSVNISYQIYDMDYNPDTQFVIVVNNSHSSTIDIIFNRKIYYTKCVNTVPAVQCIECGSNCKEIINREQTYTCSCCDNEQIIKTVYECVKCCTKYIYF